ncbi:CDP-alcohol phosphatidyltransferase family protein [Parasphingorhabdus cellanae]|uniref:CDP-alcohol phosphatidyltransferase family protein n=1 Tax=Parasphingorhabdus cellanae TaxID=2806553 RepID=A0ABX7T038_9SPHN|nr:CDP-alcohol phosphatidyltransferase family protein [Parasphingorhabdus cellanae]QTD54891.1 CDP-alcohol phosphatidyltransferase family protein [Parasphingorhabdus cellanae]
MQTANGVTLLLYGENDTLIWGMTNAERARRLAAKLESAAARIWVNLDYVFDPLWMRHIQRHPGMVITVAGVPVLGHVQNDDDAERLAGLSVPAEAEVVEYTENPRVYNHQLRKLETPFVRQLTTETVKDIERQSYFGAYKGVTDILTKYLWPELALVLTRFAARLGMTPNMVTAIGAVGCIAAPFLFYYGYFWSGMAAGFVFMVLDTVDGKLARCTITSSFWGNIFDHGLDLVHPPFWWVAWALGLGAVGLALPEDQLGLALIVIIGGYVLQRIIEGIFMRAFDQHIHVWRPWDSWFRLITARRNPNMVLLFASMIFGRPDIGLLAVAWWTLISLAVHMVQIFQAALIKMRGGEIISWLEQEQGQE